MWWISEPVGHGVHWAACPGLLARARVYRLVCNTTMIMAFYRKYVHAVKKV